MAVFPALVEAVSETEKKESEPLRESRMGADSTLGVPLSKRV